MRYLILNADDCGYCPEESRAVLDLLDAGLITSTSLLTVAPDFPAAAKALAARKAPCGIHLAITCDSDSERWKPASEARSLSEPAGLYVSGDVRVQLAHRADVRTELEAQLQRMKSRGLTPDHADAHSTALYGLNGRRFFLDVFEFCSEHHLPFRFPRGMHFAEEFTGHPLPGPLRIIVRRVLHEADGRHLLLPDNISSNPWNIERIGTLENLRNYYFKELELAEDGVTEMFLHPAYPASGRGKEWKKREWEREILASGCLVDKAKRLGIQLISWGQFAQMRPYGRGNG